VARGLATLSAAGGGYAAYEQLTLLWGGAQSACGSMLRMYMTRLADAVPVLDWLLDGPADCVSDANTFFGLPLAAWVLALCAFSVVFLWLQRRPN